MIIWSGYGILVVPIVLFSVLAAYIITGSVADPDYIRLHGWPLGVALFAAAAGCWFLGRRLRDHGAKSLVDPETGQVHVIRRGRSLFFIPMEWWAIPIVGIGTLACTMNSTPEELRERDAEQAARQQLREILKEERPGRSR